MAHTRRKSSRQHKALQRLRQVQRLRPALSVIFFGLCVGALAFAIGAASGASHAQGGGPGGGPNGPVMSKAQAMANARCGVSGKPACPPARSPWVPLKSESPSDIIVAAQSTVMYRSAVETQDLIGDALRQGRLGTPVLVRPYRNDVGLPEVWVIPVVNSANIPLAMLEFVYDRPNRQMRASEFDAVTGNMFYATRPFPSVGASTAISTVAQQHHVDLRQGNAPELVYFPSDHMGVIMGTNIWSSGGTAVIDPIWRVPGADGHWHYVDHNGKAHLRGEIPVDPAYPVMP